jgi:hypothetical protein
MIRLSRKIPGEKDVVVGFLGFHRQIDPVYNYISAPLATELPVVVAELDRGDVPDLLFFSVFGPNGVEIRREYELDPRYERCTKIFACEENIRPPWGVCEYALTSDRLVDPTHESAHLRVPNYVNYLFLSGHALPLTARSHWGTIIKPTRDPSEIRERKTKFCNFVYSNASARVRLLFYGMLSRYKKVDSAGRFMNNVGGPVPDKCAFVADYKFTIAFENSRYPGYVSEKLLDPMMVDSVPIYWGDPGVHLDFNPRSFVDANEPEGESLEDHFNRVIDRIVYLDTDDDAYDAMVAEPWFPGNVLNSYCSPDRLLSFVRKICEDRP